MLIPICIVFTLVLIWQGVPDNFSAYTQVKTVEGAAQSIAQGPVASQIAIKQLGTNGGGFFNANSAHPFENPTPLANFLEVFGNLSSRCRIASHIARCWAIGAKDGRYTQRWVCYSSAGGRLHLG